MAKKTKVIIDASEQQIGEAMDKQATKLATMIDASVSPVVSALAEHKREYQGGPFVVMHNITSFLSEKDFDLDSLPEPHSKEGNNPAHYKIKVPAGKDGYTFKDVYFYTQLALSLPSVTKMKERVSQLTRSLAKDKSKVKTDDIPKADFDRMPHDRMAEIDRLNQQITVAKSNVSTAFELYHQLKAFAELDKVEVVITYDINGSGDVCDGEDGRPFVVAKINSPIMVRSTIKGREDIDKGRYSVSSFLKFDIPTALEAKGGATFAALEATLAKGAGNGETETGSIPVNTLPTFVKVLNDECSYLAKALDTTDDAAWSAMKKLIAKEDGDQDFFYNVCYFVNAFEHLVKDPRNQVRYQKLLDKKDEGKAKAA